MDLASLGSRKKVVKLELQLQSFSSCVLTVMSGLMEVSLNGGESLGIELLRRDNGQHVIGNVTADGQAAKEHVQEGWVIVELDGAPTQGLSHEELVAGLTKKTAGPHVVKLADPAELGTNSHLGLTQNNQLTQGGSFERFLAMFMLFLVWLLAFLVYHYYPKIAQCKNNEYMFNQLKPFLMLFFALVNGYCIFSICQNAKGVGTFGHILETQGKKKAA